MKICEICKLEKELNEYYFDRNECNSCSYARRKKLVIELPEEIQKDACFICGKSIDQFRSKYCSKNCLKISQNNKSKEWHKRNIPK